MSVGAMAPTRLGAIVKQCRKIEKLFKFMERRAETDCIIAGITLPCAGVEPFTGVV